MPRISVSVLSAFLMLSAMSMRAQDASSDRNMTSREAQQSLLSWTPAPFVSLARHAEMHNSFVLDRTMLSAMQAFLPESDERLRPALHKLDGISVHLCRFHDSDQMSPSQLEDLRQAYQARGWKHLVSSSNPVDADSASKKTDLWLAIDGMTVRGGAMLLVSPRSITLVTFAGDLSPVDILHLCGHFGIPAANGDSSINAR